MPAATVPEEFSAENMKKKVILIAATAVLAAAAVITAVCFLLPQEIIPGYYSSVNENRAQAADDQFVRDLYLETDKSGRLTICDSTGNAYDVFKFNGYRISGGNITFTDIAASRPDAQSAFTPEDDGSFSLTLKFTLKDGGFVLDSCHYERIKN